MADRLRSSPLKLLRLWKLYAYMDFMWMTRDFQFFITCLVSELIISIGGITAVYLLAQRFDGIGVWSQPQVLFLLGYATTVNGLLDMLFAFNIGHISRRIGRGQLDHTLIQPQPVWMALLTEGFMPFSGSAVFLTGVGLTCWATADLHMPLTPAWVASLIVHLIASSAIALSLSFLWGCLAFWEPRAAEEVSTPVVEMVRTIQPFPLDGLGSIASFSLLTVLPVGFVAWYPCRHLLGIDRTAVGGVLTTSVAAIMVALAILAFKKGMNHYGRTGSQRYLDRGHRS